MNFPCQSAITTLRYLNDITSQFAALLICRYLRLSSTSLTDPFHQISVATVLAEKGQKLYAKTKKSKSVLNMADNQEPREVPKRQDAQNDMIPRPPVL